MTRRLLALALFSGLLAAPAAAHTQSYGFLSAAMEGDRVSGAVELAVRDLDAAVGLDRDGDGRITWGEVRAREAEIADLMVGGVSVGAPGGPCSLGPGPLATETRGGETTVVAPFAGACPAVADRITVGYDLMFDVDAQHRALVQVAVDGQTRSLVMSPEARTAEIPVGGTTITGLVLTYVGHGIHHILIGYDHILFVVTLLLGAASAANGRRTGPAAAGGGVPLATVKLLTAFTLAHSVTLALAAFGVVAPPPRLTEAAIAATITLAALNVVWPVVTERAWLIAFGFGLVHGFGFANVLSEMALPTSGLVAALFAFNVGVELGQLLVVALVFPLILVAGRSTAGRRVALPAAALLIAVIGTAWLIGRVTDLPLLPIG